MFMLVGRGQHDATQHAVQAGRGSRTSRRRRTRRRKCESAALGSGHSHAGMAWGQPRRIASPSWSRNSAFLHRARSCCVARPYGLARCATLPARAPATPASASNMRESAPWGVQQH